MYTFQHYAFSVQPDYQGEMPYFHHVLEGISHSHTPMLRHIPRAHRQPHAPAIPAGGPT